jgi:hypothetical protein
MKDATQSQRHDNTDSIHIYHANASWGFRCCAECVLEQAATQGHCHIVSLSLISALVTLFEHIICRTQLTFSFCGNGSSKLGIEWYSTVRQSSAK